MAIEFIINRAFVRVKEDKENAKGNEMLRHSYTKNILKNLVPLIILCIC